MSCWIPNTRDYTACCPTGTITFFFSHPWKPARVSRKNILYVLYSTKTLVGIRLCTPINEP